MVQENPTNVSRFSNKTPQLISDLSSSQQGNYRTTQTPKVENLCLESQWETRLNYDGWSELAITFHSLCLAESTKKQYDSTYYKGMYELL